MQVSSLHSAPEPVQESPEYVRLSLAAAMTLGFVPGWFYRNARLRCVNLLLTYAEGCKANCSFCGLAGEKFKSPADRKFIRVPWKTFRTNDVIEAIAKGPQDVGRVCISMITHPRCKQDVLDICRAVATQTDKSVSLLISPTLLKRRDLEVMKDAGADRVGVAIDAATPELFERLRGRSVRGPHQWEHYWNIYEESIEVFGRGKAGVHLICGLGETERQLAQAIWRARFLGGCTHLFSFFPEKGSMMESSPSPQIGAYRRIQLARMLIDSDLITFDSLEFDALDRIRSFGLTGADLQEIVCTGSPFETSGCPGPDGRVACNRPYGNEKPGPNIRNFPFTPDADDISKIRQELWDYGE
ncbi:MAG TPA: radical SAM protein [Desulfomonilaceae bacterium]|nr:radical SAM protein [Desulfomonilaceae bacterium]